MPTLDDLASSKVGIIHGEATQAVGKFDSLEEVRGKDDGKN